MLGIWPLDIPLSTSFDPSEVTLSSDNDIVLQARPDILLNDTSYNILHSLQSGNSSTSSQYSSQNILFCVPPDSSEFHCPDVSAMMILYTPDNISQGILFSDILDISKCFQTDISITEFSRSCTSVTASDDSKSDGSKFSSWNIGWDHQSVNIASI